MMRHTHIHYIADTYEGSADPVHDAILQAQHSTGINGPWHVWRQYGSYIRLYTVQPDEYAKPYAKPLPYEDSRAVAKKLSTLLTALDDVDHREIEGQIVEDCRNMLQKLINELRTDGWAGIERRDLSTSFWGKDKGVAIGNAHAYLDLLTEYFQHQLHTTNITQKESAQYSVHAGYMEELSSVQVGYCLYDINILPGHGVTQTTVEALLVPGIARMFYKNERIKGTIYFRSDIEGATMQLVRQLRILEAGL